MSEFTEENFLLSVETNLELNKTIRKLTKERDLCRKVISYLINSNTTCHWCSYASGCRLDKGENRCIELHIEQVKEGE